MNVVELELNSRKLEVDGNLKKENLKLLNLITPILAVTAGINIQIIISYMLLLIIPLMKYWMMKIFKKEENWSRWYLTIGDYNMFF